MEKSIPKPRMNQRRRTRAALVASAGEAVRHGQTPTVAEAAEAAGISRATAYRYFQSQQSLLVEVSLDVIGEPPVSGPVTEGVVQSRVDSAISALLRMSDENETLLRTFLKLSMDQWLQTSKNGGGDFPLRKGRRVPWIEKALEPLASLPRAKRRRLTIALSLLCGIEALVVGKDIFGCSAKETEATARWAAQAILAAALAGK